MDFSILRDVCTVDVVLVLVCGTVSDVDFENVEVFRKSSKVTAFVVSDLISSADVVVINVSEEAFSDPMKVEPVKYALLTTQLKSVRRYLRRFRTLLSLGGNSHSIK